MTDKSGHLTLHCLTSAVVPIIIATATRGRRQTLNVIMGRFELLADLVVFSVAGKTNNFLFGHSSQVLIQGHQTGYTTALLCLRPPQKLTFGICMRGS